jgi:hypothetical protein
VPRRLRATGGRRGEAQAIHTQIEEESFHPGPGERGEVEDHLLGEAYVEHASAENSKILGEYIKHHVWRKGGRPSETMRISTP